MKTIINILLSGSALLLSASCSKWLDIMPQGMTTEVTTPDTVRR